MENFSVATLITVQRVITYRWRDFLLVYQGSGAYYLLKVRYRWNDFMHRLSVTVEVFPVIEHGYCLT